jgi:multidrug efflux pump subunit AcrB
MCALLLKPHTHHQRDRWWARPVHGFFRAFNFGFDALGRGYGWLAARVVRFAVLMVVVYAGVILFGLNEFQQSAGWLHPASRSRLPYHRSAAAGGRFARTNR